MHYGMYGFGWFWGVIIMVFFVILILVLIRSFSDNTSGTSRETPLQILERRYANGELSTEEFRERKKELTGKS